MQGNRLALLILLVVPLLLLAPATVPALAGPTPGPGGGGTNPQTPICPNIATLKSIASAVSGLMVAAVIVVIIMVAFFTLLGPISMALGNVGTRIAEQGILMIIGLFTIYMLFFYHLSDALQAKGSCGADIDQLITSGPYAFRFIGALIKAIFGGG